ncbi:protein-methionine-sulfoxide reductase heme-binding subunit MsrQ [Marinobacterium weihaiense]|uniref:Protein-methionine-sulfoxide reductase heme-binding subunit MsrQ n=1 Tax=Marinobacterium weihaiense TaxID=2851016 RepID=A0ABS6MCA9_9GAMM|nr:protein-methionine-sulfoxide reductase heme-binding subunit MsrQ [Marinobacterium weihaiense]MBV0933920.1 sulfoxide reductase heme-binding subunit YedZ [Marinobacterium weihaiense]
MVLSLNALHRHPWGRWLFWALMFGGSLLPLGWITLQAVQQQLGADPAQVIVTFLGIWALRFLWVSLAVTPLRRLPGMSWVMRYRRMLGLYALFYASLHLLAVATFILGWRPDLLLRELTERPYIIVGFTAWVLLLPLALTSTKGWQRRLGKRWKQLHALVYPASLLVMLHFAWLIRAGYLEVLIYALILAFLLGYRLYLKLR